MTTAFTPNYNAAAWIGRCCQSLKNNEGDFEFLMINDSSTDDSESIVREYAEQDSRFALYDNCRTKGVSGARNCGLDHAKGDWLAFLDADDEMAPDVMRAYNNALKVGGFNMYQFDHWRYYAPIDKMVVKYRNPAGVYSITNRPILFCFVWNKLYKADFVRDIRFDEQVSYCEDELFNWECIAKDKKIYCLSDETVIHHFENPNSLTKSTTAEQLYLHAEKMAEFIKRQDNPVVKCEVCLSLSEHWQSNKYLDVVGERSKGD